MKASSLSFRSAILFVLAGMVWGIVMAISQNHAAMPAHAHLNLLGYVSLFLFGFYYRLHPAIDASRTALAQVLIWVAATVVLTIGVALVHTGHPVGDPTRGDRFACCARRYAAVCVAGVSPAACRAGRRPSGRMMAWPSRFGSAGGDCGYKSGKRLILLVPVERIELPTFGLQNRCSTAELNRLMT